MAEKIRRIDFSPDEFLVGVSGLPSADIGVYWVVCALMYSTGGEIAIDDRRIFGVCSDHKNKVKASIKRLIDAGVLHTNGSHLTNKRVTKELDRAQTRITKAVGNGKKGGRPRAESEQKQSLKKPNPFPDEKLTNNYQLTTNNQHYPLKSPKGDFPLWWSEYPHKKGKAVAEKAYLKAIKTTDPQIILEGMRLYVKTKPADRPWLNPATFLNQERWNDEPDCPTAEQITGRRKAILGGLGMLEPGGMGSGDGGSTGGNDGAIEGSGERLPSGLEACGAGDVCGPDGSVVQLRGEFQHPNGPIKAGSDLRRSAWEIARGLANQGDIEGDRPMEMEQQPTEASGRDERGQIRVDGAQTAARDGESGDQAQATGPTGKSPETGANRRDNESAPRENEMPEIPSFLRRAAHG